MIIPRVLVSSSKTDLTTTIFNTPLTLPFGFAPWAMNTLSHPDGELIPAKIARENNMIFGLSTLSTKSYSEIAAENGSGMRLMQMYITHDWALTVCQVRLAEKYGFAGLAITVDAQVLGTRRRAFKNTLDTSQTIFPVLEEISNICNTNKSTDRSKLLANRDISMNWETIKRIRSLTNLKIVLKGIMHPKDA